MLVIDQVGLPFDLGVLAGLDAKPAMRRTMVVQGLASKIRASSLNQELHHCQPVFRARESA